MARMTVKNQGELLQFLSAGDANISSCKVYFSPKQGGEGTPSPENVRPIEGWSGVEVTHCGKNLLGGDALAHFLWPNLSIESDENGRYVQWNNSRETYVRYFPASSIKENTQYTFILKHNLTTVAILQVYYSDGSYKAVSPKAGATITKYVTSANKTLVGIGILQRTSTIKLYIDGSGLFEGNIDAADFEPYQSRAEKELPSEYQRVEYLESTGKQWIDTGIIGRPSMDVEANIEFTNNTIFQNCGLLGSREDGGNTRFYILSLYNFRWHVGIREDKTDNTNNVPTINEKYKVEFHIDDTHYQLFVNNTSIYTFKRSNITTYPMYMFACNNYGTVSRYCAAKVYSMKITQDDVLVRNYIPCLRRSDSKPGMYDTVSQTFYTNQGTGEFIAGPAVNRYEIDWSEDLGTIYGGYVDLVSGELVETWDNIEISKFGGISKSSSTNEPWVHRFTLKNWNHDINAYDRVFGVSNMICDICATDDAKQNYEVQGVSNTVDIYLYDDTISTVDEFKEKYANHYIAYPINEAAYTYHQLSPAILTTLTGSNTFWSNADYIEIEYDLIETQEIMDTRKRIMGSFPHLETAGGQFSTDMAAPLKSCRISFSPIQEGEGDPSPSNVRPIRGWDGVTVKRCGKNLYDPLGDDRQKIFIPKSTYITAYGLGQIKYYREDGTLIDYWSFSDGKKIFKLIEDAYYFGITDGIASERMIGIGNNIPYEPYQGSTYTIPFPQTIYGGYVNLVKGEIVEEQVAVTLDGVNVKFNKGIYSSQNLYGAGWVYANPLGLFLKQENKDKFLCDKLPIGSSMSTIPHYDVPRAGNLYYMVRILEKSDYADELTNEQVQVLSNEWLQDNPLTFVYPLKTANVYSLTPQTIKALKGINNVFSDANGSVELTYWTH